MTYDNALAQLRLRAATFVLQNSTTDSPPLIAYLNATTAFYLALFRPFWAEVAVFAGTGDFARRRWFEGWNGPEVGMFAGG